MSNTMTTHGEESLATFAIAAWPRLGITIVFAYEECENDHLDFDPEVDWQSLEWEEVLE